MMRKRAKWMALVAIAPLIVACGSSNSGAAEDQVTVGSILPMTGEAAFIGENVTGAGATLAIDVANKNGGVLNKDVKLVIQDSQRRTEPAISGLRALQGKDVTVGIGPSSATIPAVINQLKQGDAPWIPIGSSAVLDTGLNGSHVWRNFASDTQQLPAMLLAAAEQGGKIGLVFENNASGQQQATTVKKFAPTVDGITIVDELELAPGQASYQSEASEFFNNDYDAILWQLADATAAGFFKSAERLDALSGQHFIGTDASVAGSLLTILKPYLSKADFVGVTAAAAGPGRDKFVELYGKEHDGEEPPVLADVGYDATTLLLLAVEAAGSQDPEEIAAQVPKVTTAPGTRCNWFGECAELIRAGKEIDFDGAVNTLAFNDEHNVISPFALISIGEDGTLAGEEDIAFTVEQISSILESAQP